MKHIEFTGISCVGKSTLYNKVISNNQFYGGYGDGALIREFSSFPDFFKEKINSNTKLKRIFEIYLSNQHYTKFTAEYCNIAAVSASFADNDKVRLADLMRQTAWKYQIGHQTVRETEILTLDEGFLHRAASIAVRSQSYNLPSVESYFNRIPLPKVLVYVDAPDEIINMRKKEREGEKYSPGELTSIRNMINHLCTMMKKNGVKLIQIKNVGEVSKTVDQLTTNLEAIFKEDVYKDINPI